MKKLPQKLLPIILFLFVPIIALALTLTLGTDVNFTWSTDAGYNRLGQSFLAVAGDYTQVTINKGAAVGGGAVVPGAIQADNSGDPSGTDLATFSSPIADEN